MYASRRWPNGLALLLCIVAPPLGFLAWVLGNADERPAYLASRWVRAGLVLLVLGTSPLILFSLFTRDPNPNPIGLGLLFVACVIPATACLAIGAVWVWFKLRRAS
ncbi:MAG: hypothetical protein IPI06_01640 [Gammaproteobacteria bacterium]|nr:hypothetical protein [Gammaproteobacteria bacterium]